MGRKGYPGHFSYFLFFQILSSPLSLSHLPPTATSPRSAIISIYIFDFPQEQCFPRAPFLSLPRPLPVTYAVKYQIQLCVKNLYLFFILFF